jgi:hypothetical protein
MVDVPIRFNRGLCMYRMIRSGMNKFYVQSLTNECVPLWFNTRKDADKYFTSVIKKRKGD